MKEFIGELMQQRLDKKFDARMNFEKGKRRKETNARNEISSTKKIKTKYGELPIDMTRDRDGSGQLGNGTTDVPKKVTFPDD